jgi:hypothetical protein
VRTDPREALARRTRRGNRFMPLGRARLRARLRLAGYVQVTLW